MITRDDIQFRSYPISGGSMVVAIVELRAERATASSLPFGLNVTDRVKDLMRRQLINHIYGDIERKVHELRHAVLPKMDAPNVQPIDEMFQELIEMLNQ